MDSSPRETINAPTKGVVLADSTIARFKNKESPKKNQKTQHYNLFGFYTILINQNSFFCQLSRVGLSSAAADTEWNPKRYPPNPTSGLLRHSVHFECTFLGIDRSNVAALWNQDRGHPVDFYRRSDPRYRTRETFRFTKLMHIRVATRKRWIQ